MKKSQPVMYRGLLRDEIIYSGLMYTQSNTKTYLGKPRKVLKVKSRTTSKVKSLRNFTKLGLGLLGMFSPKE